MLKAMPWILMLAVLWSAAVPLRAEAGGLAETQRTAIDELTADPAFDPAMRQRLVLARLINQTRTSAGLPALIIDARLMTAAQAHSHDMKATGRCSHGGSDGSTTRQRIRAAGYAHDNWAGENILCSTRGPEEALGWWLASAPHRRNLLHAHYAHVGVGYDPDGPYGPMWTLVFASGERITVMPRILARVGLDPATPGTR